MIDNDQPAVAAFPVRMHDNAVGSRADWRSHGSLEIDARVNGAFTRKRIGTPSEAAHQASFHRPHAWPDMGLPMLRVVVIQRGDGGVLEEIVVVERLAEGGRQRG